MTALAVVLCLSVLVLLMRVKAQASTGLKTFPSLFDVTVIAASGLVIHAYAQNWVFTVYRIGTALWLLTFVYAAAHRYQAKEVTR